MAVSDTQPAPVDRSGRGYIAGSGVFLVLTALLSLLRGGRETGRTTAYYVGEIFGSVALSALVAVIIFAIARAATRGKPRSTPAKILFWMLAVWFILMFASFIGSATTVRTASAQSVFSKEDREGLRVRPDSITHSALGFALPTPGTKLTPSPLAAEEFNRLLGHTPPDLATWAFVDSTEHWAFILQVVGMPDLGKEKFLEYAHGFRDGIGKRAKVVRDTTIWDERHRETQFVAQHPNGIYLGMRCIPSMKPRREYVLCIQTFTAEPATFAKLSGGLTVY